MAPPLLKIRVKEVEHIIQSDTHPTKAPEYDLITGKLLKELPKKVSEQSRKYITRISDLITSLAIGRLGK
jgi:hypothetical protein